MTDDDLKAFDEEMKKLAPKGLDVRFRLTIPRADHTFLTKHLRVIPNVGDEIVCDAIYKGVFLRVTKVRHIVTPDEHYTFVFLEIAR